MSDARQHLPDVLTETVSETTCLHCGVRLSVEGMPPFAEVTCTDCQTVQKVPAKLGHFLLLDLIGTGGMGGVYFAEDLTLGRRVAIKVMLKSLGDDPEFVETFRREAQAIAKLNHPNIAQIYSFGMEKDQPYIVMELVSGYRFDKMVEGQDALDQGLVAKIGLDIAEGLAAASEVGLIHGDIKPENILLDEKLNAKLVDFGLASFKQQTSESQVWGTPYYIAPEKIRRKKADERSDIYSLGATLYHALAGKPPFDGDTPMDVVMARLKEPPRPLSSSGREVNPRLGEIVMRMLEQQPTRRHPTYASLVSDLRAVVKSLGADKLDLASLSRRTARMRLGKAKTGLIPSSLGDTSRVLDRTTGSIDTDTTLIRKTSQLSDETTELLSQYRKQTLEDSPKSRAVNRAAIIATVIGLLILGGLGAGGAVIFRQVQEKKRMEAEATRLVKLKQESVDALKLLRERITRMEVDFKDISTLSDKATDLENRLQAMIDSMDAGSEFDAHTPAQVVRDAALRMGKKWTEARTIAEAVDALESQIRGITNPSGMDEPKQRIGTLRYQMKMLEALDEEGTASNPAAAYAELEAMEGQVVERKVVFDHDQEDLKRREALIKKEEAARAKIDQEMATLEAAIAEVLPLLEQRRYRQALVKLTPMPNKLKTPPAQSAARVALDRIQRLDVLYKYVIDFLHDSTLPYGYYHPRYKMQVDVLDADVTGIKVRGSTAAIPWSDITDVQYRKFVEKAVAAPGLTDMARGDQHLNAAVWFDQIGLKPVASQYAESAARLRPALQAEVKRLLSTLNDLESATTPTSSDTAPGMADNVTVVE